MKPRTVVEGMPLKVLMGLVQGQAEPVISDKDFLERLAARRCFLVPPWVLRAKLDGGLERVALLSFDRQLNLDKNKTLGVVLKALDESKVGEGQEGARGQARHAG